MLHTKKLKTILQSNYFYVFLFLIVSLYCIINIYFKADISIYNNNQTVFEMIIVDYEFDGNKLSLDLKGEENLVGSYYINTYEELLNLKETIKYGLKVEIVGTLKENIHNTIPYAFDYDKYLKNKNIYYSLDIESIDIIQNETFIYKIKNHVNDRIEKIDKTGYMKAFILGNKDDLEKTKYNKYQKIGITHLFALSGMHIGLLSGIILKLFKKINDKIKYLLVSIILVIYGYIVAFPYSIKRCIIFFIINSLNKLFNLQLSSFKVLLITIFIIILSEYKAIYDIGFIYSIITVGGILLTSNFIKDNNKLFSSFKLSLVAFLFSLPISLYSFYEINILSVLYNIFFVPFVSIIVYPLCLLSFLLPVLNNVFTFFINVLEYLANYLSKITILNIYMSFNIIEVLIYYTFLLLVFIKEKKYLIIGILLLILINALIPYLDNHAYVYFLDVGQGDSSLIITPYHKDIILIDTGGITNFSSEKWKERKDEYHVIDNIISMLKALGIKKIDSLILSHGDYDHMGESINLVNNFKVEKVIFNCGPYNNLENELIKVLDMRNIKYYSCIKELNIGNNKLYFLNTKEFDNENDNSNVIYTELNNYKFLLMGDASALTEKEILNKYNLLNIDVLKVGHHGSKTSSGKEFIDKINPKYSLISVGKNNRYGHPNNEVLENLNASKIYRTDKDGSIMFKIKKNKLDIKTCEP